MNKHHQTNKKRNTLHTAYIYKNTASPYLVFSWRKKKSVLFTFYLQVKLQCFPALKNVSFMKKTIFLQNLCLKENFHKMK